MNWSKEHLEARMLDALEGRLSDDQMIQLQQLLLENPEFGDLADSMIFVHQDETIEFDHSALLKKESFIPSAYVTEVGSDKEKMAIAKLEGVLSKQEEKDFEHLLKVDQELKQQWELVQQTKLIPNAQTHFPSIKTLIKERGKVIPFRLYFSYAAAASIALLLFLNWPTQGSQVKSARKATQKPTGVVQKDTKVQVKVQVAETNRTNYKLSAKLKNISVEHVDPSPNDTRVCIAQEIFPEVEQSPSSQSLYLTPPIIDPIELATVTSPSEPMRTFSSSKNSEPIGIREFVIQKGNEKLFGTAKPTTAEKYTTITNYLAQSTKIPITYIEKEDEKVKTTFFKLGFITIERKQTKK
jgi:hypothetical protein